MLDYKILKNFHAASKKEFEARVQHIKLMHANIQQFESEIATLTALNEESKASSKKRRREAEQEDSDIELELDLRINVPSLSRSVPARAVLTDYYDASSGDQQETSSEATLLNNSTGSLSP